MGSIPSRKTERDVCSTLWSHGSYRGCAFHLAPSWPLAIKQKFWDAPPLDHSPWSFRTMPIYDTIRRGLSCSELFILVAETEQTIHYLGDVSSCFCSVDPISAKKNRRKKPLPNAKWAPFLPGKYNEKFVVLSDLMGVTTTAMPVIGTPRPNR